MNPGSVFISGGTGFIGSKLVEALIEKGHIVHALVRPKSETAPLPPASVRFFFGDLLDPDSIRHAMRDCQYGFHLAAYAKNWAPDPRTFFQHNVDGARNVLSAAKEQGVEKFVFTSTIVTFGPTRVGTVSNEGTGRTEPVCSTEYEESKVAGEKIALDFARDGFPVTIVNPTRVYGPGKLTEGNSLSLMIQLYQSGKFPFLLNRGRNVGNYALVDDVVRGQLLALERGKPGERYILGGENASLKQLFDLVDEASQRRHLRVPLPGSIALAYSWVEKQRARFFSAYPKVTPGWVRTFLLEWAYSCEKAKRELGYTVTPLREGIRQTVEWLQKI